MIHPIHTGNGRLIHVLQLRWPRGRKACNYCNGVAVYQTKTANLTDRRSDFKIKLAAGFSHCRCEFMMEHAGGRSKPLLYHVMVKTCKFLSEFLVKF